MVQKLKFHLSVFLVKIDLEIVFADVLDRQKGFPDYKNADFIKSLFL